MAYLAGAQLIVVCVLLWTLHNTHQQEVRTIHGLLELQDQQRSADLERVDNLLRANHAHMAQPHPDLDALINLVDRLCQRLQAPEQAIVDHSLNQPIPPIPPTVLPDDDKGYWEALNLPKEDLAEHAMESELSGT